jgi:hypothetical protein
LAGALRIYPKIDAAFMELADGIDQEASQAVDTGLLA